LKGAQITSIHSKSSSKLKTVPSKVTGGPTSKGMGDKATKETEIHSSKVIKSYKVKSTREQSLRTTTRLKKSEDEINLKSLNDLPETMLDTLQILPYTKNNKEIETIGQFIDDKKKSKVETIKKAIAEVESLLEEYTEDIDKFSPKEIKSAFKLLSRIHKINIENVTPHEVREVISLAEELKIKRDIISAQLDHLKAIDIEEKLSEASLKALESKLELIVRYFDDNIEEITTFIRELGEKTSFYIKEYYRKAGKSYWTRIKINKARVDLKQNVQFLVKLGNLDDKSIKKAKQLYMDIKKSRRQKKRQLTGKIAQKFADLIGIEKKVVLNLTRQRELRPSIEEIFEIRTRKK